MHSSAAPKARFPSHFPYRKPMLSLFRRLSKSKIGKGLMVIILVAALAGFGATTVTNFGSGTLGFGMTSSTLAKVGDQDVSEREMSDAMQRRLQEVRQQRPEADYASILGDFNLILESLLDDRTLMAFADKYGLDRKSVV